MLAVPAPAVPPVSLLASRHSGARPAERKRTLPCIRTVVDMLSGCAAPNNVPSLPWSHVCHLFCRRPCVVRRPSCRWHGKNVFHQKMGIRIGSIVKVFFFAFTQAETILPFGRPDGEANKRIMAPVELVAAPPLGPSADSMQNFSFYHSHTSAGAHSSRGVC